MCTDLNPRGQAKSLSLRLVLLRLDLMRRIRCDEGDLCLQIDPWLRGRLGATVAKFSLASVFVVTSLRRVARAERGGGGVGVGPHRFNRRRDLQKTNKQK